jgi:hypothetical protein
MSGFFLTTRAKKTIYLKNNLVCKISIRMFVPTKAVTLEVDADVEAIRTLTRF